jgi:cyclophilin family peptidyl-prolyl cis-trans isomerase
VRPAATAACLTLVALAGCGGGTKTSAIPSAPSGSASAASATVTGATGSAAAPPAGCTALTSPPRPRSLRAPRPAGRLDPARTYIATVTTNCGTFAFRLDVRSAPKTTASIAWLARRGFFDGTIFHRIAPGYVIQGGDPTGTGRGGPGYKTVDPPPAGTTYVKGVVAMAKAGPEAPGTSGSQFFVVTGDASNLSPDYALVGRVVKGLDVVERIGRLGDQLEQPTTTVAIERFRVTG